VLIVGVAGILVRPHLAVAVTALLVVRGMLLLLIAAGMTVAGHGGGEALAIVHVDVGDRDFTSADSRALAFALCRHDSIVVIGVLQEVLRRDTITGCAGIAGELKILLEHLIGIAADPNIGTRAVKAVRLARLTATTVAVRAAMRLARAATATPSILIIRSHASITSHCCGPGFALRRPRRIEFTSGEIRKCAQSSSGVSSPGDRHSDVGGRIRGAGQPAAVVRMFTPEPKRP
jgi:hypothetical protein